VAILWRSKVHFVAGRTTYDCACNIS